MVKWQSAERSALCLILFEKTVVSARSGLKDMEFDQNVLTKTEKRIFALRTLYSRAGYSPYRMLKFEDYDLYSRNKDFLVSDRVITFTDTNGRLKALKPDVTMSLVRNIKDMPDSLQRLYYDENVYRVSARTNCFKEIMQMGLECIGAAGNACVSEILKLAEDSLALISEGRDYVLKVSDFDLIIPLVEGMTDDRALRKEIYTLIGQKNIHGIEELCRAGGIDEESSAPLTEVLGLYGPPADVLPQLERICAGTPAEGEVPELSEVLEGFGEDSRIVLDFSITSDTSYYNGVAIEGYIDGLPDCVIVGGRYDRLMQRMHRKSRAIGFAVYLDALAALGPASDMSAGGQAEQGGLQAQDI